MSLGMTIGKFAEANHTTVKTLRVYEKAGVLVPSQTDPETGYRYYTEQQCSAFDMIKGLQMLGYSLEEIEALLKETDVLQVQNSIGKRTDEMRLHLHELKRAIRIGDALVEACEVYCNHHNDDSIYIEELPARKIMRLGILEPKLMDSTLDGHGQTMYWASQEHACAKLLAEYDGRLLTFHNIGGMITCDHLRKRLIFNDDSFVFIDEEDEDRFAKVSGARFDEMPAGTYVTHYQNLIDETDSENYFVTYVNKLIDYAEAHGYAIAGN